MFEASWIDDLTAAEAADELARARDLVLAAEATQFLLAAHWADLHAPELVADTLSSLPGTPRAVRCGPEGCPEIEEYAGAELAVLLGRSTASGERLMRDGRDPSLDARWLDEPRAASCAGVGPPTTAT